METRKDETELPCIIIVLRLPMRDGNSVGRFRRGVLGARLLDYL